MLTWAHKKEELRIVGCMFKNRYISYVEIHPPVFVLYQFDSISGYHSDDLFRDEIKRGDLCKGWVHEFYQL